MTTRVLASAALVAGIGTAALCWLAVILVDGAAALLDILTIALERTPS